MISSNMYVALRSIAGPACLPAALFGDRAAKRLWGIFVALPAKHLLPITQRGQL